MKIALYQGLSPAGAVSEAFLTIERMLAAAAVAGARMLVLPELFRPGYNCPQQPGQVRGGPWHQRLSLMAAAAGCGVTVGYSEADGEAVFNSAVTFGAEGKEVAHYRKVQLYGARENALFTPGDRLCAFDHEGIRLGLLICYDIEFAPHIRALAADGVTLILCPTANMMPFAHVSRLTVPSQAANHALAIAYANYCGAEGDLTYCGGSVVVGPDGDVLASAGQAETLLIVDVPRQADPAKLSSQLADLQTVSL